MNYARYRVFGPLLILFLLTFQQCAPKRKGGEDKEPGDKKSTGKSTPAAPATINQIHFFMETSASMGGYLRGQTNFKNVVSELITKANQIRPVKVWTIAGQPKAFTGDYNQFVVNLATTPLATAKSSELHRIFRQVGEQAKGNNIALLASDCILSFSDAEIKQNPEINRDNAESVLKSQINDQFANLKRQGISATVYAFTSPFNGTYYDYQNRKHPLSGESRPFYIWVIGKQELVGQFNRQMHELLSVKPTKQLDFGASGALKQYDLFFSLNKKGKWRAEKAGVAELEIKPSAPAQFAIGVNLNSLPAYAQTDDYIRKNLVISGASARVKLVNVQQKDKVADAGRLKEREAKLLNQNTHVLTFQVSNLYDPKADVALRLPVRFDDWYQTAWSTMDDRTPAGRQNKTFALVHLMNGVKEAYQSASNDFLELTIQLQK